MIASGYMSSTPKNFKDLYSKGIVHMIFTVFKKYMHGYYVVGLYR